VSSTQHGAAFSIIAFTVRGGKIVAIDSLADPDRLRGLNLASLDAWPLTINLELRSRK
jgi:RNA polymerase sigma-70 factor (ECF subfamily)